MITKKQTRPGFGVNERVPVRSSPTPVSAGPGDRARRPANIHTEARLVPRGFLDKVK